MNRLADSSTAIRIWVTMFAVLALGMLIYRDFLFGNKVLLYKDAGSDSLNIFYPNYVLRSDYLRNGGIPPWAFQVGRGQSLFPSVGGILLTPVVWLPKA